MGRAAEPRLVAMRGFAGNRGLAVVDHDFVRHPAELFERTLVAAEEPFLALAERKLDVQPAAVRQDQDKEAQRSPRDNPRTNRGVNFALRSLLPAKKQLFQTVDVE